MTSLASSFVLDNVYQNGCFDHTSCLAWVKWGKLRPEECSCTSTQQFLLVFVNGLISGTPALLWKYGMRALLIPKLPTTKSCCVASVYEPNHDKVYGPCCGCK